MKKETSQMERFLSLAEALNTVQSQITRFIQWEKTLHMWGLFSLGESLRTRSETAPSKWA